jgi:hypothetical protein
MAEFEFSHSGYDVHEGLDGSGGGDDYDVRHPGADFIEDEDMLGSRGVGPRVARIERELDQIFPGRPDSPAATPGQQTYRIGEWSNNGS